MPLLLPRISQPEMSANPFDFAEFIKAHLDNDGTQAIDSSRVSATASLEGLSMDSGELSARCDAWARRDGLQHVSSGRDAEVGV